MPFAMHRSFFLKIHFASQLTQTLWLTSGIGRLSASIAAFFVGLKEVQTALSFTDISFAVQFEFLLNLQFINLHFKSIITLLFTFRG